MKMFEGAIEGKWISINKKVMKSLSAKDNQIITTDQ